MVNISPRCKEQIEQCVRYRYLNHGKFCKGKMLSLSMWLLIIVKHEGSPKKMEE